MAKSFQQKYKVGGSTNYTFLAMIPKEVNPSTFERFRPISLCNSSYKILEKLLANRIKPLLGKLISPSQGGFIKGRHIIDNVIQVQEDIHSSFHRKEQGMIIKLDMANAFDWVKHSFIFKVFLSFRFSSNFVNLIKACITKLWIAPLVNGRKLEAEKKVRTVPGIRIVKGIEPINHSLFADDSLLLGGASLMISKSFSRMLQYFCSITRALINKRKSTEYDWNT